MNLFHREKQESKDALEQLQAELDAETADETETEVSKEDDELSLVEKLTLEAEEEIRMEKRALEAEEEIRMEKPAEEMGLEQLPPLGQPMHLAPRFLDLIT